MTLTRPAIRALLYDRIPQLGAAGTADSVQTDGITDPFLIQDSNKGANALRGLYIYRPGRTDDDRIKKSKALSGAKLEHSGSNYSNTADLEYELVGLMTPDELNACIARAVKKHLWETRLPLTHWVGGDGEGAASLWTPQDVNGTTTKGTVAKTEVFSGRESFKFVSSGTSAYTGPPTLNVTPGDVLYSAAICRAAAASTTLQLTLWDMTNDVIIGTTLTHTEQAWQHFRRKDTVPAGCYGVRLRCGVAESGVTAYWDCLPGHNFSEFNYSAPSWLDEKFKLASFGEAVYRTVSGTGRDVAASRQWEDWFTPQDYVVEDFNPEATANWLNIYRKKMPERDLWFHGRRPYTDIHDFENETDATSMPEEEVLTACEQEIALICKERYPNEARWKEKLTEVKKEAEAERAARPVTPMRPQKRVYGGRGRGF